MTPGRIRFNCPQCQQQLRVSSSAAGKAYACPSCRAPVVVPTHAQTVSRASTGDGPPPTGMANLVCCLVISWASLILVLVIPGIFFRWNIVLVLSLVGLWSLLSFGFVLNVLLAKARLLRGGGKQEVDLFFGMVKLVAWNPNEGVVLLRNKSVSHLDDDPYDGGGLKLIYPILGDELALRVPLERQPLEFVDHHVVTRDFIPLQLRGVIEWEIVNIEHFFLRTAQEIQGLTDRRGHFDERPHDRPKVEVAKHMLALMAEERTRSLVSQAATGLLVAQNFVNSVPQLAYTGQLAMSSTPAASASSASGTYQSATGGLAQQIEQAMVPQASHYGIVIHRVALQEVKLPPEIDAAARDAYAAAFLPAKARATAEAQRIEILAAGKATARVRKMHLQGEADVIGAEAVAAREVLGSAPAMSSVVDFLNQFFVNFGKNRTGSANS